MVISKKQITKALIGLRICAVWSAPVLFANSRRQVFSCRGPNNVVVPCRLTTAVYKSGHVQQFTKVGMYSSLQKLACTADYKSGHVQQFTKVGMYSSLQKWTCTAVYKSGHVQMFTKVGMYSSLQKWACIPPIFHAVV